MALTSARRFPIFRKPRGTNPISPAWPPAAESQRALLQTLLANRSGVPNDNARDVPDVALSAADHDGYLAVSGDQLDLFRNLCRDTFLCGNRGAAEPVFGLCRCQAQPGLGNINPALYRLAQSTTNVFHDITTGGNIVPCRLNSPNCQNGSLATKPVPDTTRLPGWARWMPTSWSPSGIARREAPSPH